MYKKYAKTHCNMGVFYRYTDVPQNRSVLGPLSPTVYSKPVGPNVKMGVRGEILIWFMFKRPIFMTVSAVLLLIGVSYCPYIPEP